MNKENNKRNKNDDALKMVCSVDKGDNVKAYKLLEKIVKNKLSKKLDDALKDA